MRALLTCVSFVLLVVASAACLSLEPYPPLPQPEEDAGISDGGGGD